MSIDSKLCLTVRPVNEHDTELFPHSFDALMDIADLMDLDVKGAYISHDAGFDSMRNKWPIDYHGLILVNDAPRSRAARYHM